MSKKAKCPYIKGQWIQVKVYNYKTKKSEWKPAKFDSECWGDDKPYRVCCTFMDGTALKAPFGAAPECVRKFQFRPFRKKYIVGYLNASSREDFCWHAEAYGLESWPWLFVTKKAAKEEIKEYTSEEGLGESEDDFFISTCSLTKFGSFKVNLPDGSQYFKGSIFEFMEKHN